MPLRFLSSQSSTPSASTSVQRARLYSDALLPSRIRLSHIALAFVGISLTILSFAAPVPEMPSLLSNAITLRAVAARDPLSATPWVPPATPAPAPTANTNASSSPNASIAASVPAPAAPSADVKSVATEAAGLGARSVVADKFKWDDVKSSK